MKKILILLFAAAMLSGCYTTLYPTVAQQVGEAGEIPDSTKQIIINNYYESNEYYQVPHHWRYSLLWDSYYWDPFYYDYSYYHWQPYYWYGSYYYYNPYNHYWYYYPPSYYYGGASGGSGENRDRERIRKPGYQTLMSTSESSVAPFISVGSDNGLIGKPGRSSEVDVNSGIGNNSYSPSPRIESVGKSSATDNNAVYKSGNNTSTYKPSSTNDNSKKSSSSSYSAPKSSSNSAPKSKPSRTTSSSTKSSSSESTKSNEKK